MRLLGAHEPVPLEFHHAVVAIGNFDGLHRGHKELLLITKAEAERLGKSWGIVTFEPHPRSFFKPDEPVFRLTPLPLKVRLAAALGASFVLSLNFDKALSMLEPQDFIQQYLVEKMKAAHVVTGYDFHFGRGRKGNPAILKEFGQQRGFDVTVVENDGLWVCPDKQFRRPVDYLMLSVGGNDVGFRNVVAWATLRSGTSATLAKFLGATVSAKDFARNVKDTLPGAYARLAKAIERAVPLYSEEPVFDATRVILSAYPDMLVDETGAVCPAGGKEEDEEDR